MKKQSSVTILLTVKNSIETIEKCIRSLLDLNYINYKIYITDAFSTDGTYEKLKNFKRRYPRKIILEQLKGNIAKAHNHMIKKTNTEFIAMTDADCVVEKNWIRNLISGFSSKDIIATAGFCSTPKNVNMLQKLIGRELENRFRSFPEFISRTPTMNLCIKASVAKKIRFDERFDVAQETDWGYRITKLGKMKYVPNAIVYHYHRPTVKSFFKQQFKYGKNSILLFLKHKKLSDHITTSEMFFQELIFGLFCLSILVFIFYPIIYIPIIMLIFLILVFLRSAVCLSRKINEIPIFLIIFSLRYLAWTIGKLVGIFLMFFQIIKSKR